MINNRWDWREGRRNRKGEKGRAGEKWGGERKVVGREGGESDYQKRASLPRPVLEYGPLFGSEVEGSRNGIWRVGSDG